MVVVCGVDNVGGDVSVGICVMCAVNVGVVGSGMYDMGGCDMDDGGGGCTVYVMMYECVGLCVLVCVVVVVVDDGCMLC